MLQKYNAVIADTSCFILLDKIDELPLLQILFEEIITSQEIAQEFGNPLPNWVKIKEVQDRNFLRALSKKVGFQRLSLFWIKYRPQISALHPLFSKASLSKLANNTRPSQISRIFVL